MAKKKPAKTVSAKKTLRKVITLQIVKQLTDITGKLSSESKSLTRSIEKGAKKLAKNISKEIKLLKTEAPKAAEVKTSPPALVAPVGKPEIKKLPPAKPAVVNTTTPKVLKVKKD